MKLNRLPGLVGAGILLLSFGYPAAAQTQQDTQTSLGDVVKQKPVKKAAKVITDDDMPQKPAEPPPAEPAAADKGKEPAAGKQPAAAAPAQPDTTKAGDGTVLDTPERRVELAKASEAASKAKIEDLKKRRDAATTDAEVADIDAQLQREQNYLSMYTAARQKAEAEAAAAKRNQQQAAPTPVPAPSAPTTPPQ